MRMVLVQALRLSIAGVAAGLLLALVIVRSLQEFVFGISVDDPATLSAAVGFLILVASVASLIPARRAAAIDPVMIIKAD